MNGARASLVAAAVLALAAPAGARTTTGWVEHPSNPVFSPGKAYYPCVLLDGGTYRMWSTKSGGIQYATSADGMTWSAGQDATSGLSGPHHVQVKKFAGFSGSNSGGSPSGETMYYRMWYWGSSMSYTISDLRYAESADGLTWHNDQPITQVGSTVVDNSSSSNWNRGTYGPCDVFYNPGGSDTITEPVSEASVWANKFVMYYDGTTGGDESIGLAVSNDGRNWQGYNGGVSPVLAGTGNTSDWDWEYVSYCTVAKDGPDAYHMWYSGGYWNGDSGVGHGIGYASSTDGINWVRDAFNPIFHKDDGVGWRDRRTYTPQVIGDQMWFSGKDADTGVYAVGYAVPEPAALGLLGLGAAAALIRRRRRT